MAYNLEGQILYKNPAPPKRRRRGKFWKNVKIIGVFANFSKRQISKTVIESHIQYIQYIKKFYAVKVLSGKCCQENF